MMVSADARNETSYPEDRARAWWMSIQPDPTTGRPGDRAALARLRRATLQSAMMEPATLELLCRLGWRSADELPATALCTAVLAHVRDDDNRHPAGRLGSQLSGDRRLMSPLRFQRLLRAESLEDRLVQFRRAVALAGQALNVRELAAACLDWSEERRRRWLFEYVLAGSQGPAATATLTPGTETSAS